MISVKQILAGVTLSASLITVMFAVLLTRGLYSTGDIVLAGRSLLQLPENDLPSTKPLLYIVSLSYMDQMTWAAKRLKSIQCWASMWQPYYDVRVVEPFVTNGTHLGVPVDIDRRPASETLRFRDLFDIVAWNADHGPPLRYPQLVSWDYLLSYAPRDVVAVQIVYRHDYRCSENEFTAEVCSPHLTQTLSRILKDFTVVNQVCINFRLHDTISLTEFNDLIFWSVPKRTPITVVFEEWRGMGRNNDDTTNQCFLRVRNGTNCTPNGLEVVANLTNRVMMPSLKIKRLAKKYISKYLNEKYGGYLAVMVRWEKVILYGFYENSENQHYTGNNCTREIKEYVQTISAKKKIQTVFLATDIGRYGSTTFKVYNSTRDSTVNITSYTEDLMRTFYGNQSISLEEYEQRFEKVSGTTNPAMISQLQKAIAANARCLLLVGMGAFHENTMKMYRKVHNRLKYRCLKVILAC